MPLHHAPTLRPKVVFFGVKSYMIMNFGSFGAPSIIDVLPYTGQGGRKWNMGRV